MKRNRRWVEKLKLICILGITRKKFENETATINPKPGFSRSTGLKNVFQKLCFLISVGGSPNRRDKVAFQIPPRGVNESL